MSDFKILEMIEKKFLGHEATEKLIENLKNSLSDKLSYNEQTLTPEEQEQSRTNIGAVSQEYVDSQRLGYAECKTLTYDGSLDEYLSKGNMPEDIGGAQYLVRLLDTPIDLYSVTKIQIVTAHGYSEMLELNNENSRVESDDETSTLYISYNGMELPVLGASEFWGTLTIYYESVYDGITCWTGYIEYDEIVHKIDQKLIPDTIATDEEVAELIDSHNTDISAHDDIRQLISKRISYNEQSLTPEQQTQARKNIGVVQADYAQNDETAPDYVKNRLAYVGRGVCTYTYDGNEETRLYIDDGLYLVKVSDELTDYGDVVRVTATSIDGQTLTCEINDETSIVIDFNGIPCLTVYYNESEMPVMVSIDDNGVLCGTYIFGFGDPMNAYVSKVEYYGEVVYKLDKKYYDSYKELLEDNKTDIIPAQIFTFENSSCEINPAIFPYMEVGTKVIVTINGIEYASEVAEYQLENSKNSIVFKFIGNIGLAFIEDESLLTEEPYVIVMGIENDYGDTIEYSDVIILVNSIENFETYTGDALISVRKYNSEQQKIKEKYLPSIDYNATESNDVYIKNKPMCRTSQIEMLIGDTNVTSLEWYITDDSVAHVVYDDVEYECPVTLLSAIYSTLPDINMGIIGNHSLFGFDAVNVDFPFGISFLYDRRGSVVEHFNIVHSDKSIEHTVSATIDTFKYSFDINYFPSFTFSKDLLDEQWKNNGLLNEFLEASMYVTRNIPVYGAINGKKIEIYSLEDYDLDGTNYILHCRNVNNHDNYIIGYSINNGTVVVTTHPVSDNGLGCVKNIAVKYDGSCTFENGITYACSGSFAGMYDSYIEELTLDQIKRIELTSNGSVQEIDLNDIKLTKVEATDINNKQTITVSKKSTGEKLIIIEDIAVSVYQGSVTEYISLIEIEEVTKIDPKFIPSTDFTESDPTVPSWAKAAKKPSYTKSEVGLGNVDNTSDANKPVSTAQATAIADAKKAGTDAQANLTTHTSNKSNPHGVTKAQVGLGNVDNVKQYSANNPPVVVRAEAPTDTSVIWVDTNDNTMDSFTEAVNTALAQAKENGEFNPVKGVDYWTEEDRSQMIADVISALPDASEVSY